MELLLLELLLLELLLLELLLLELWLFELLLFELLSSAEAEVNKVILPKLKFEPTIPSNLGKATLVLKKITARENVLMESRIKFSFMS